MAEALPALSQFRVESRDNGLVHLVFDCPDRSMNVFSNTAIHELGEFAEWLHRADVRGVVVRSGKASGFCAGADLTELGVAYDTIVAAPAADRFDIAFDHFFPLSHALRRLETAGKPVAAAIAGVALGGGCELALGCHHRVLADTPRAMLGLPECGVGLLPGAGGTQRMPRLVGLDLGLEVLLQGRNLQGDEALAAGLVDALVEAGEEVAAAEAWLLSGEAHGIQPWDREDHRPLPHAALADALARHRRRELERMLGHEPAPLAILDCVEFGLIQPIDGAIRAEMSVFASLIQRREPRNMIRTMFLGKQAFDKARRAGGPEPAVLAAAADIADAVEQALSAHPNLARAGFGKAVSAPAQNGVGRRFWLEHETELADAVRSLGSRAGRAAAGLNGAQRLQLDHLLASEGTVPAYFGGAHGLAEFAAGPA